MTEGPNRLTRTTRTIRLLTLNALLLAPSFLLATIAASRLPSALALERAYPVPAYVATNVSVPHEAYRQAAQALAQASDADGEAQIARAEILLLSGEPMGGVTALTKQALAQDPASARGWALLATLEEESNPAAAGEALGLSLELAPYDYYLAGRRAELGAHLWPSLSDGTRQSLARQLQLLWSEPSLRTAIRPVLDAPHGGELVTQAFRGEPDEVRALNRELQRQTFEQNSSGGQP